MKPQLTLVAFLLLFGSVTAQVKFKVKLLNDNQTYQVLFRPETTWNNPLSTTLASTQVSLKVPSGGFTVGTITDLKGSWALATPVVSPVEAPGFTYLNFYLEAPIPGSQITYTQGVEIPMFSFVNTGACTGPVEIIENGTDPFYPPNSQNYNIGNSLSTIGAGSGVEAYIGNYTSFEADCLPGSGCGIEVFDVALVSPSACGVADGSITIDATNSNPIPMQYTITYGTAQTVWQSSPIFPNLAAGDTYYVAVRDVAGICFVEPGEFELAGPLAAILQSVDLVDPACGGTNGSITLNAVSANGGTLQFAMSQSGPWQASSTFNNLAEGTYSFWVRDITNNCENFLGTYNLDGCVEPSCILTYDLQHLGNGRYEVNMITDTTWNGAQGTTSSLRVTLKVPTGGFEPSNLTSQVPNVLFTISSIQVAPTEDPAHDYISIILDSPGTTDIPYFDGNTVHLFYFENTGTCNGDSIRLMLEDDPFVVPNSQNADVGQQITVAGYGSGDAPICIGNNAALCAVAPPPAPDCPITYVIEELPGDVIQVSIISDTTWNAPWNFTSAAQVTVKVPTGGFVVDNLTALEGDWDVNPADVSPAEEPNSDYLTFYLATPTNLDVYEAGVKVPIFTFKNSGTCQNGSVTLMADNDPFYPPNAANSNVGQYISPAGSQGEPVVICLSNLPVDDCTNDPCAALVPGFTAPDACESSSISFTNTTTSIETVASWSWDFGDNSALDTAQAPTHVYSSSGNFEVSLTVTTQGGCSATFMDFVTVFPSPGDAPVSSYTICDGLAVTLETPDNITSASWSPSTGLDLTDPFNPIANPSVTTVYTLTASNTFGCTSTSQVTVNVLQKPVLSDLAVTAITDCNKSDATITVTASGVGSVEYGLDSGSGIVWQSGNTFINLAAGSYNVYVRNGNGSCTVAYNNNPILFDAPVAPSISSVTQVDPSGCNNGSITINTTGGMAPLQYSITGTPPFQASNVFSNLGGGTYNIVVRNNDGTCATLAGPIVFAPVASPTIVAVSDQNICVGSTTNIVVQFSTSIASYEINGTGVHSGEAINGNSLNFMATANAVGISTYDVVLTAANGCSATESFTLTGAAVPTAAYTFSPVICTNGQVTLSYTGMASPSANLSWSLAGGNIVFASSQNATSQDSSTIIVTWPTGGPKTVTLLIDNGGCQVNTSQTVNVSAYNPGATTVVTNASCGLDNGAIDLTVTGSGFSYAWSNGATNQDPVNLAGGVYTVTITETASSCQATTTATVGNTASVSIDNVSTTQATSCTGSNGDGSMTIQISGGTGPFTYALNGITPVSSALTSLTFSGLSANVYTLTVTNGQGCTDVQTVTITSINSQLSVTTSVMDAACTSNNGSITATVLGGQQPYTYSLLHNNQPSGGAGLSVNGNTLTLNGLEPGNYTLIFEDAVGCIAAGAANVERMVGQFLATATITPAGCGASNGAISLAPANVNVTWTSNFGVDLGNANPLTNLVSGIYTATILEANGCTSSATFNVSSSGGQDATVNASTPATCGNDNGSVTFTVAGGGNSFSYNVLGTNYPSGFGTTGNPVTVPNLGIGAYVLEITDLSNPACKIYEPIIISGGSAIQTSSLVTFATGCGNENGQICIEINGGNAPFTVVASDGVIEPGAASNLFCVQGLYEGIVSITILDGSGCEKIIAQDMGAFDDPAITVDSIQVTSPTCPGELGSIISTSTAQYQLFDSANSLVGITPWTAASPGTYTAMLTQSGCTVELGNIVVSGPGAWSIVPTVIAENCTTKGSISLAISGGTAPYAVDWSNNGTGAVLNDLAAGTYTATVTDEFGCTILSENVVADSCIATSPCEEAVFYIDTYNQALSPIITEICLPTNLTNLADYVLELNGELYQREIGDCGSTTNFYNFANTLPINPPFVLERWDYDAPTSPLTNFTFQTLEELVNKMKEVDGYGNWALDNVNSKIHEGQPGRNYGSMKIKHPASGSVLEIPVSKETVPHPTVLVENSHLVQVLIAINPLTGCADTLYINMIQPEAPTLDTILVEVPVGESVTVCIPNDQLYGTIESISNEWISFTDNAEINTDETTCVEVVGVEEGTDQAYIVICDDLGVCDTTVLLIDVIDGSTDIKVYTGFSPNNDGVNDVFRIRNIELYPNNDIKIFNRWGKSVFAQKGYRNNWQAIYRNTYLPDGSYFYILNVMIDGKKKEYKGFVEVRR